MKLDRWSWAWLVILLGSGTVVALSLDSILDILATAKATYPAYVSSGSVNYVAGFDGRPYRISLLPWLIMGAAMLGSSIRNLLRAGRKRLLAWVRLIGLCMALPASYFFLGLAFTFINPDNASDNELASFSHTGFLTVTVQFARGPEVTYSFVSLVIGIILVGLILAAPFPCRAANTR